MTWGHRRLVAIWLRKNWTKSLLVLFFLGVAIWGSLMSHLGYVISNEEPWYYISSVVKDIGTELVGIVIAVVTIDYLNERRQEQQLKEQLIMQMGSRYPDVTDTAIRSLKAHGGSLPEESWLTDGSLKGASLQGANLEEASLRNVNLEEASLWGANLMGARLEHANLKGASMIYANLGGAALWGANLKGATLYYANLEGASLVYANLEGANLWHATSLDGADLKVANLKGASLAYANLGGASLAYANLGGVKFLTSIQLASARNLEGAIMPDRTRLFTEGSRIPWVEPCLDCPTIEKWLEYQRLLPPDERAIVIENEVDAEQEQPESASPEGAALTEGQADEIKRRAKEAALGAGIHINSIYSQIRQEFNVKSTNGLTQNQYPAALEFLGHIRNGTGGLRGPETS